MTAHAPDTTVRLQFFGGATCVGGTSPLTGRISRRHPLAVLAVLAVAGERGCSRDRLIGCFWGDDDERRARHHLSDTLYIIRRALGDGALAANGGSTVALDTSRVPSDVAQFERAIVDGALEEAASLYTGHFLEGFHVDRALEFEQWRDAERARLQAGCADVLEVLAHRAEEASDWAGAVSWWQRAWLHDPYNSRCVRALARALVKHGDRGNALCVVREHVGFLERSLGTEPPPEIAVLAGDAGWDALIVWRPPAPPSVGNGRSGNGERAATVGAPAPACPALALPDVPEGEAPAPSPRAVERTPARRRWLSVATSALVVVLATVLWTGMDGRPDDFTVAIVPFAVDDPALEMWGEGVANLLYWKLNGAGPLRAVSPRRLRAAGPARISASAVHDVADQLGARFALYGSVHANGGDSVRVLAWLLDVDRNEVLFEADVPTAQGGFVSTADSVAARALVALSESRGLGRVAYRSLGSSDHKAIGAFITGDWFLRDLALDSAVQYYRTATQFDSTFAIAYSHWALALRHGLFGERQHRDEFPHLQLTAGRLNQGLAPRESVLLVIDSLDGALWTTDRRELLTMELFLERVRATIDDARARFPDDPEVWFRSAEVLLHWTPRVPGTHEEVYRAIARAIALDSTWMHGYAHSLEYLTWSVAGPDEMRRSIEAYRRHLPAGYQAPPREYGLALVEMLLDGDTTAFWEDVHRIVDEADDVLESRGPLWIVFHAVGWTPDTLEIGLRLMRLLGDNLWTMGRLTHHGHMDEARPGFDSIRIWDEASANLIGLMPDLTLFGAIPPPDSARRIAERGLDGSLHPWSLGQGWWGEAGDTVVMKRLAERWDSLMTLAEDELPRGLRGLRKYGRHSAHGYLALARGDTAEAIAHLERYVVSPFIYCRYEFATLGKLYAATGQLHRADATFRKCASTTPLQVSVGADVYVRLLWARVLEQLGNRREATRAYRFVADAWRRADAALQPYVDEARAGLARLEVRTASR